MEIELRTQAITAIQQAWQTCQTSARLYQALADRELSADQRALLLQLAASAKRHADQRAHWLSRLGAPLPPDEDTILSRAWRWVLLHSSSKSAIAQIERAMNNALIRSATLLAALGQASKRQRHNSARF